MSATAIHVENLGKRYRIGVRQEAAYRTLRSAITDAVVTPFRHLRSGVRRQVSGVRNDYDDDPASGNGDALSPAHIADLSPVTRHPSPDFIWALKDVSFTVARGEVIGVIGRNGAGKSTLLKILARITAPTEGCVRIRGRVGSLLEVGTGFHPELTGRENIFLNGAILGMKRGEILRKFDEIVGFAEIEKFIDTPVKFYSSGMYVRLAFAVAAHLEPETLVVDEVLAVGDASFQKKCLGKMGDVARQGRTVFFVSHNMGAIQGLCGRAIWVEGGKVRADGKARQIVDQYIDSINEVSVQNAPHAHLGFKDLVIERVLLKNDAGEVTTNFQSGENFIVEIHYNALARIPKPYFWISVYSKFGALFGANMLLDELRPQRIEGKGAISCCFHNVRLMPQMFTVSLGVRDQTGTRNLVLPMEAAFFRIAGNARDMNMPGEMADALLEDSFPMIVPYEWRYTDGRVAVPEWDQGGWQA